MICMRMLPFKGQYLEFGVFENKKISQAVASAMTKMPEDKALLPTKTIFVKGLKNQSFWNVKSHFEKYGKVTDFNYNDNKGIAVVTF